MYLLFYREPSWNGAQVPSHQCWPRSSMGTSWRKYPGVFWQTGDPAL